MFFRLFYNGNKATRANQQKNQKTPIISILAVGNTIVGKTELIKCYKQLLETENKGN